MTKVAELTVYGKMHLLYLIELRMRENEGRTKTANIIFSPKVGPLERTKVLLMSVIGANECLGLCDEVRPWLRLCISITSFSLFWVTSVAVI